MDDSCAMTPKQLLIAYLSIPDCIILVDGQQGIYKRERNMIETADADCFYLQAEEREIINLQDYLDSAVTLDRNQTKFRLSEIVLLKGEEIQQDIYITVAMKIAFPIQDSLEHETIS